MPVRRRFRSLYACTVVIGGVSRVLSAQQTTIVDVAPNEWARALSVGRPVWSHDTSPATITLAGVSGAVFDEATGVVAVLELSPARLIRIPRVGGTATVMAHEGPGPLELSSRSSLAPAGSGVAMVSDERGRFILWPLNGRTPNERQLLDTFPRRQVFLPAGSGRVGQLLFVTRYSQNAAWVSQAISESQRRGGATVTISDSLLVAVFDSSGRLIRSSVPVPGPVRTFESRSTQTSSGGYAMQTRTARPQDARAPLATAAGNAVYVQGQRDGAVWVMDDAGRPVRTLLIQSGSPPRSRSAGRETSAADDVPLGFHADARGRLWYEIVPDANSRRWVVVDQLGRRLALCRTPRHERILSIGRGVLVALATEDAGDIIRLYEMPPL